MAKDTDYMTIGVAVLMVALMVVGVLAYIGWYANHFKKPSFVLNDTFSVGMVSGTEYRYGDAGQVIVEVRDRDGTPVQSNCTGSVWYPNKTIYINKSSMLLVNSTGNSYINFTVPRVSGVYEYQANCTAKGLSRVASKSFHVSPPGLKAEMTK